MKFTLITALFCAVPALLPAQSATPAPPPVGEGPRLTPEQTATIMKQLDALESVIGKNRGDILGAALARCSKAMAAGEPGALQLYLDCYKLEHFDRENLKVTDYQEWAKRNQDRHKDPEFLTALWLQLHYLVLSIQAQDAQEKDMPALIASLQSHISRVSAAIQAATKHTAGGALKEGGAKGFGKGGGRGQNFDSGNFQQMLRQSVKNSEFAKAFLLEDYLRREDWTYDPFDIKAIYEQVIFPYYLEKKPAELAAQWDSRIKTELSIRAAVMSESEYSIYYKDNYPGLQWQKAEFLVSHNVNPIPAMADMLKLIRENPTHPAAGDWLKSLRQLVNGAQPPLPPSGTPENPAPAAATN